MAVNKVIYDGRVLIDISDSTASESNTLEGVVSYDAKGNRIIGTLKAVSGRMAAGSYDAYGNLLQTWDEITEAWKVFVLNSSYASQVDTICDFASTSVTPPNCATNALAINTKMLVLPQGLLAVGKYIFYKYNNRSLTTIIFNRELTTIGAQAFSGHSEMTTITLPPSITSIVGGSLPSGLSYINVPWAEGEVAGAPWGASRATVNYNYKVV